MTGEPRGSDTAGEPAEMPLRGRRVALVPADGATGHRWPGQVVDHADGVLQVGVDAPVPELGEGAAWFVEVGRAGDARYRLHGRVVGRVGAGSETGRIVRLELQHAERVEGRRDPRAPLDGRVGVVVAGSEHRRLAWVRFRDVSASGVAGACSVPLAVGDELVAHLRLPTFPAPLGFRARVVRVEAGADERDACAFGARLLEPSLAVERIVRGYVAASSGTPANDPERR